MNKKARVLQLLRETTNLLNKVECPQPIQQGPFEVFKSIEDFFKYEMLMSGVYTDNEVLEALAYYQNKMGRPLNELDKRDILHVARWEKMSLEESDIRLFGDGRIAVKYS